MNPIILIKLKNRKFKYYKYSYFLLKNMYLIDFISI